MPEKRADKDNRGYAQSRFHNPKSAPMTSGPDVSFLVTHISLLSTSYHHWTGEHLLPPELNPSDTVHALNQAPFAVVSHGTQTDPIFNYGNTLALQLFEMDWEEFTALPSRLSAEAINQQERKQLLAQVDTNGYSDNYAGVRISKSGRRFMIRDATVWNLIDRKGHYSGQAALIRTWQYLESL